MAFEDNCINIGLAIQQMQTQALVSAGKVSVTLDSPDIDWECTLIHEYHNLTAIQWVLVLNLRGGRPCTVFSGKHHDGCVCVWGGGGWWEGVKPYTSSVGSLLMATYVFCNRISE